MAENKAVAYMRISEWTKPIKLTEQREKCHELANLYGYEIVDEIQEVTNERRSRRMGIQQVKALIDMGKVDTVIATEKNKFYHESRDLKEFIKYCDEKKVMVITLKEGFLNLLIHVPDQEALKPKKGQIMKM